MNKETSVLLLNKYNQGWLPRTYLYSITARGVTYTYDR